MFCIQNSKVRWDFDMMSQNGATVIVNFFPKEDGLQIEAPAAISPHSQSTEWQQTTTVMQRQADRDGWIDRWLHMQTCLLINSCWQQANTLGSSVEMSVMLTISLHAFQVGCPQPVTVGVLRPAHKAHNMPKHFFITCQIGFQQMSVQTSLLLYVTRTKAVLIFDSDEQIMYESRKQLKWVLSCSSTSSTYNKMKNVLWLQIVMSQRLT